MFDVVDSDRAVEELWAAAGPELEVALRGITEVAQMSLPLQGECRAWGALNLYGLVDGALDDVSRETGGLLAASAAAMLGLTRKVGSLTQALASRTTIGTAIGIVMEHEARR
ncbi:MAG: hypothetical protein QOK30_1486 [Nocardioidaceae bacterium]|jgi:hypothetical protein|nr:hypothetical protein [Nocardioidaceae bacterium]